MRVTPHPALSLKGRGGGANVRLLGGEALLPASRLPEGQAAALPSRRQVGDLVATPAATDGVQGLRPCLYPMTVFCSKKENGGRKSLSCRDLRFPDLFFLQVGPLLWPRAHRRGAENAEEGAETAVMFIPSY